MRFADVHRLEAALGSDILERLDALDGLVVGLSCSELSYSRHWQHLMTNRDFALLWYMGRVFTSAGGTIFNVHNNLVKWALQTYPEAGRLLQIEYDHEVPEDCFRKHAAYTEDLVGGLYVLRDMDEPLPVFGMWDEDRRKTRLVSAEKMNEMLTKRGLYPVDVVPMGCTSISFDLLRRWPKDKPWYSSYAHVDGTVTDDTFFCRIAQDFCGVQPYLDTSMRVQHYALVALDDTFFFKWYNTKGWRRMAELAGVSAEDIAKQEAKLSNGVHS